MSRKHLHAVQTKTVELDIPDSDLSLMEDMSNAYEQRRLGSLNHNEKSVRSDAAIIHNFFVFIQKAAWDADEDDFDAWCYDLGHERKLVTNSQRKYQSAVQMYYRYIANNVKFQAEVMDRYGIRIRQIVTEENKIPHVQERQRTHERPAFTHAQITHFMDTINAQIVEAAQFHSKELLALQRDKVMFYTMYILGLRNSEACNLHMNSFQDNPKIPEFENFGFATIYGKGSKGSGPKIRTVPVDHPDLPPLLAWYIEKIRPIYLKKDQCDPNEQALFITERGSSMKPGSLIYRFKKICEYAGLDNMGFTPHCLRHTFTTHSTEAGRSLEYTRRKLGHEYAATTQGYTHCGDEFVNRELSQCAGSLLDQAMSDNENMEDDNEI